MYLCTMINKNYYVIFIIDYIILFMIMQHIPRKIIIRKYYFYLEKHIKVIEMRIIACNYVVSIQYKYFSNW